MKLTFLDWAIVASVLMITLGTGLGVRSRPDHACEIDTVKFLL